jgi:CBS domain-containing protein
MILAKTSLVTIHKDYPIESAFDLMVSNNIRRLIVIDDEGDFCGVILQENLSLDAHKRYWFSYYLQ